MTFSSLKLGVVFLVVSGFLGGQVLAAEHKGKLRTEGAVKLQKGVVSADKKGKGDGQCRVYEKEMCEGYSRNNQCTVVATDRYDDCDKVTVPTCIGCIEAGLQQTDSGIK
ncbi:MAG: hypothetical protein ABJN57_04010 [Hyphomicrobiales bacterium]